MKRSFYLHTGLMIICGLILLSAPLMASWSKAADKALSDDPTDTDVVSVTDDSSEVSNPATTKLFESIEIEILNDLKGIGVPVLTPATRETTSTSDYKVALNLGVAVADAVSSAVSEDKDAFLKFAAIVHSYGERLGVEEAILAKYQQITQAADKGEWDEIQKLMYSLKDEMSLQLGEEDMMDYAVLAMTAGWLEGLYVLTSSLEAHFKLEANDVLRNRDLVRYLSESLNSIEASLKETPEVKAMFSAFPELDKKINQPLGYMFTENDVKEIVTILSPLRETLVN